MAHFHGMTYFTNMLLGRLTSARSGWQTHYKNSFSKNDFVLCFCRPTLEINVTYLFNFQSLKLPGTKFIGEQFDHFLNIRSFGVELHVVYTL